ncbi:FecR family protein [uncultured Bacteroides sp.]|uniref:FecR family protein n=1 Tax=uncultured Bacteroides sp. TaxID=162156 RepID=UPI002AAC051A|nr:FecR family protein [uncultured Bacteroides sp.]
MMFREERENKTNQAWNNLYQRLQEDGLLEQSVEVSGRRMFLTPRTLKWVASVAVLLLCGISVYWLHNAASTPLDRLALKNEKGNPTLVNTFEDGSTVYLSEQASLEYPVHFAKNERTVFLKGDAYFEVSGNPERPFIIETKAAFIKVIGTKFNVKSKNEAAFSLSVRSGIVKVISKKNGESTDVRAGQTVCLKADKLQTMQTRDYEQFNSYLKYIHFKDQTLSNVVRMINETTDSVQLKLAPELGDRLLTVTFSNDSPYTMAELICMALNLQLSQQQNIIYITQQK